LDTAQNTQEVHTRVKLPPDPYNSTVAKPKRGRRPLVLIGAVLALFVAIALVNRGTHHSSGSPASAQSGSNTATGAGSNASGSGTGATDGSVTSPIQDSGLPSNTADSVPIGYPHTAQGAQSAAANYVVAYTSSSMVRSAARHQLIAAIADPAIASSLQSQLDSTYTQVDSVYGLSADGLPPAGQSFVQRSSPMGVMLVNQTGNSTTVTVWVVTIAGLAGQGSTHPVTEAWSTVTVTLHWTDGDWKWVSFTSADGPVPASGQQIPSAGQTLQNAVSQFGGLRYAR
jgi:hypothetical protein